MLDPEPAFAQTMLTAGWFFGALTAAAILLAAVGLLLTALRNGASAIRGEARPSELEEVDRAREAWRQALLERGILPFLRDALANPSAPRALDRATVPRRPRHSERAASPTSATAARASAARDEGPKARPRYTSPDFTSPDFGGPETPAGVAGGRAR